MTSPRDTLRQFTDAAADAIARAIAGIQKDAQRERELRDAEHRARLAELDTRILAVADVERQVVARLGTLKDGEPGRDGADGKDGLPGEAGKDGADGVKGCDIDPDLVKATIGEIVEATLAGWERPQDGRSVTVEEFAPLVEGAVSRVVAALPVPKNGVDGKDGELGEKGEPGDRGADGAPGDRGETGPAGADGRNGSDGKDGERGPEGPAGKLPVVRSWSDKVYYQSDIVAHEGATFQALRDTAKEPPHEDWICIALAGADGRDGRSFTIRGTFAEGDEYHALDVVALGGASFAARRDNPGACPGEGWQLIAAQGKRGNQGERGKDGVRGSAAPQIVGMSADNNGLITLTNHDGTEVTCDLYPLLAKL